MGDFSSYLLCLSSLAEKVEKIGGCSFLHFRHGYASEVGDLFGDMLYLGGVVPFAPVWHWCEVRGIGFDQHAFERHAACHILQLHSILEGEDTRKREVEIQLHGSMCHIPAFGKAVHHTAGLISSLFGHDA